jgi:hypothetical protein
MISQDKTVSHQQNTSHHAAATAQQAAPPQQAAGLWLRPWVVVGSYIVIGVVALLLRVLDLGGFLTVDETTTWIPNSYRFLRVLQSGTYEATPFMGHPAITTMWLGSAGVVLRRLLFDWGLLTVETFPLVLALNRLPTALLNGAGVLLGYGLLRRMLPPLTAALAALLWATDPFIIAFSRVLHMDAVMGTFATLSLLTACFYWHHSRRMVWLVLSAVCAGLAMLSKMPAGALAPLFVVMAVGVAVAGAAGPDDAPASNQHSWQRVRVALRPALLRIVVWGLLVVVTIVAFWPTFWTNPVRAYEALRYGVEVEGGQPHMMGNFFLGRENPEPGVLFYPVALALRTTPWTLAGLFLLVPWVASAVRRRRNALLLQGEQGSGTPGIDGRDVRMLVLWVLVFMAGMSFFPLKFNRYLVPTFPALNILAAIGLVWGVRWGAKWVAARVAGKLQAVRDGDGDGDGDRFAARVAAGVLALVALAAVINAAWYHPYSIVYFNQLLGGPRAGAYAFKVGWGEGIDQVAAWLNKQPDIASVVTVSRLDTHLNPYLRDLAFATRSEGGKLPDQSGYIVVYYRHVQWGQDPPPYDRFYQQEIPLLVVNLHGVDYAWVYQVPRPMGYPLEADFGPGMHLHGYETDTSAIRSSGVLTVTAQWQARADLAQDYNLFVHVLNERGEQVGQIDVPLTDPHEPTSVWQPGRYVFWIHPVPVPADLPAGRYWVGVGLYDPDDMGRLPLQGYRPPADAPDDGPHVLFFEPLVIE